MRSVGLLILCCLLCSCSAVMRETGFIPDHPMKQDDYLHRTYYGHDFPTVELSSSCTSNIAASAGPLIVLPLPIIPNLLWPIQYVGYTTRNAMMCVMVETPANTWDWDMFKIEIVLNNKKDSAVTCVQDSSFKTEDVRVYYCNLNQSCGDLENSKLTTTIYGLSDPITVSYLYKRLWSIEPSIMYPVEPNPKCYYSNNKPIYIPRQN